MTFHVFLCYYYRLNLVFGGFIMIVSEVIGLLEVDVAYLVICLLF